MHLYLRLVNESGDPSVEQVLEEGFHFVEVGSEDCDISRISDNPDTAGKPQSINHFIMFYKYYSPKSYVWCIKYYRS